MKMTGDQGGNADKIGEDRISGKHQQNIASSIKEPLKKFPWESQWLTGEQYLELIQKMDVYSSVYGFKKFPSKTHPEEIYLQPQNGTIYYVKGTNIGSQFGFPRNNMKKRYRWKKMNFTTDLPKKDPQVTYIVASAVMCQRPTQFESSESSIFRMHVVKAYKYKSSYPSYILCHIRQLDDLSHSNKTNSSFDGSSCNKLHTDHLKLCSEIVQPLKFFDIFKIIHNMNQDLESSGESTSE